MSDAIAKAKALEQEIAELEAEARVRELENKKATLTRNVPNGPPSMACVEFLAIKKDRYGNENKETGYLSMEGCHANEESIMHLVKNGRRIVGLLNAERIKDPNTRREVMGIVDRLTGKSVDPRLFEASVMDQKIEKAKKDRANG